MPYLHYYRSFFLSQQIRCSYPNSIPNHCLENFLLIRSEIKKINRNYQVYVVFRHVDNINVEPYAVKIYTEIVTKGSYDGLFQEE